MATNDSEGRRAVCMSLRRAGDVFEIAFDDVRLQTESALNRTWQHQRSITFAVFTPDEIEGRISEEQCAKFGMSILDLLSYLARYDRQRET